MHLGSSRWLYPAVAAVGIVAALLSPLLAGRAAQTPLFVASAALAAAGIGFLLGSREDTLRAFAALDPLTGLYNRRRFDEQVRAEIAKSHRDRTPLAMLVIDLDHLKTINDSLGHAAGDRALLAVAEALKHSCRPTDLVARWGGDEFAVVAPCTSEDQARALGDRIASTLHLRSADRRPVVELGAMVTLPPLSVSIGVASGDSEHPNLLTPDALFAAADLALLQAKAAGAGCMRAASGIERRHIARGPLRLVSGRSH